MIINDDEIKHNDINYIKDDAINNIDDEKCLNIPKIEVYVACSVKFKIWIRLFAFVLVPLGKMNPSPMPPIMVK